MDKNIPTRIVYIDIDDREHGSRNGAINANKQRKLNYITNYVKSEVCKILEENIQTWGRELTMSIIVDYFVKTDLVKANKKIKFFKEQGTKEFEKRYPNAVLK